MITLDTRMSELDTTIRLSHSLQMMNINTVRDFLKTDAFTFVMFRNVGRKTLLEVSELQKKLQEELSEEIQSENSGAIFFKAQHDSWTYGILLKDGTVLQAREIIKKGFGWLDVILEPNEIDGFMPFGKVPVTFEMCRDRISIRIEFVAAICEVYS